MCFMCKGELYQDKTTFMVDLGSCIIVVKNVPCFRCSQCGDVTYPNEVAKKLETIVGNLKNSVSEITITDYNLVA